MLSTRNNRIDPSQIPDDQLAALAQAFARPGHVLVTDSNGNKTELPEVLFRHFARIVQLMSERKAIVMVPEDEAFTTQAAANYLGMSRQHLVTLLDRGEMNARVEVPFHQKNTFEIARVKEAAEMRGVAGVGGQGCPRQKNAIGNHASPDDRGQCRV